ncbi:MAG: 2'-deoxycytidine 5'-triphosphate deaminase [Alphaproteobacteria bacterium]|nr:2'-deoxycytidine 5'-triphosphate deaminase [Alphaproteobacteria bacterium]
MTNSKGGQSRTSAPLLPHVLPESADTTGAHFTTGVLPCQHLEGLLGSTIRLDDPLADGQLQPASLDLRLGDVAWRVRSSFLPGSRSSVKGKLAETEGIMHEIDLADGAVLERGCVYIIPLQESLRLRQQDELVGLVNPKSSIGRLDVFTRIITDCATQFDRVERGYRGPLYAEVSPRTFSVLVRRGSRLVQLRFRRGTPPLGEERLRTLHNEHGLVDTPDASIRGNTVLLTLDLEGSGPESLVGYRARRNSGVVDIDCKGELDADPFWEPIYACANLILDPDEFHILATRERVRVPPDHAAEMEAYDTVFGEFRVHYAGFFDPGFGWSVQGRSGAKAVLEVRSHEVPFLLEHGQIIGRLAFERLTERPSVLYGPDLGSHYQGQSLALSKHFKAE